MFEFSWMGIQHVLCLPKAHLWRSATLLTITKPWFACRASAPSISISVGEQASLQLRMFRGEGIRQSSMQYIFWMEYQLLRKLVSRRANAEGQRNFQPI